MMSSAIDERVKDSFGFLVKPEVLEFVDFSGLVWMRVLSKSFRDVIDKASEEVGYWRSLCNAYCFHAGIYTPIPAEIQCSIDYKKLFFDKLWNCHTKWATDGSDLTLNQTYKIKVASRFRPGEASTSKVCLPLHQFLKVKRHQNALALKSASDAEQESAVKANMGELLVGEKEPEEFVDPFMGNLMKDPVKLTTSGRVVDRSVAVQCILRGGRDPFNNERLTTAHLEAQPELQARIRQFLEKKSAWDVRVELKELAPLVEESQVDADLLEALLEVEQINNALKKTEIEARASSRTAGAGLESDGDAADVEAEEEEEADAADEGATDVDPETAAINAMLDSFPDASHDLAAVLGDRNEGPARKAEKAGIVQVDDKTGTVCMHIPGAGVKAFHYSTVHQPEASQEQVYEKDAQDAISAVLHGLNACIMCYGQTGAGKTYTFFGPDGTLEAKNDSSEQEAKHGIVIRACQELLQARDFLCKNGVNVSFTAQFVEIYEEQVTDLLTGQRVSVRRDNGHINGAVEAPINTMQQVMETLRCGHERKRFAATAMNERSSRSHTAFVVHVLQKLDPGKMGQFARSGASGLCAALGGAVSDKLIRSQLHLIDLAGSERVKKSKAEGVRLREAVGINSSLLVLGKVISSLVQGNSHVPYFESKLTTLLKAAFGGNSKTTVVINCRSDGDYGDETLQSMRFGERCAMISNSLRQAASSFETAIGAVEEALAAVRAQLVSLEARGKQHLPSYKNLLASCNTLDRKRKELVAINESKREKEEEPL